MQVLPDVRPLIITTLLLGLSTTVGVAQNPTSRTSPVLQGNGSEVAAHAIDRFVAAFNARSDSALAAVFGSQAKAYGYFLGEDRFGELEWLTDPWQYHGLNAGVTVRPGYALQLNVLGRLVAGNFVTQRERLSWRGPDGERGSETRLVIYQVRAGRIHRIWYPLAERDPGHVPDVARPTYTPAGGPTIWVDVWHGNTSTPEGTYWNLSELLRRDGYLIRAWEAPFTRAALDTIDMLIVANAAARQNPTLDSSPGSAFESVEIEAVRRWVEEGGALLLIADHQPYAGASADLAAVFGAEFHNGSARDSTRERGGNIMFRRSDGTLPAHAITNGSGPAERVDSVATFLGQAFRAREEIEPLLVLPQTTVLEEWIANGEDAPQTMRRIPVGGWLQAGVREFGEGRVALFGEAWMFRFLKAETGDMRGAQNAHFILNLMRWLHSDTE